jgi:rhamnosyltransferase
MIVTKRILIFSHFSPYNLLSRHVIFMIKNLRPLYEKVLFITNSLLNEDQKECISEYCDIIIQRENKGFDFGAWRDAIHEEGWDALQEYDSMTLMNDTCFGPIYDMLPVFSEMEVPNVDFWGVTSHSRSTKGMPGTNGPIETHIQSYFMTFGKKVIASSVFQQFWANVQDYQTVNQVIKNCETNLTNILVQMGFMYDTYMNQKIQNAKIDDRSIYSMPDLHVKKGNPFIKIKSFLFFKDPIYLKALIGAHSDYDISMIDEHIHLVFHPDISINLSNKCLLASHSNSNAHTIQSKTAMHFHVFYVDVFKQYILQAYIINQTPIDLYITTDSLEKKRAIELFFATVPEKKYLKEVVITENRGRDVSPWLSIASQLERYDYVGHFHTKKSISNTAWIGESWMSELMESMVYKADDIFRAFDENDNIGIIIPDIPRFYKNIFGINIWGKTKLIFKQLWGKMHLPAQFDPDDILSPVMPYGNMFWYRPLALKPLFELGLSASDFPPEPMPNDGTLAHAIESLPVYVAWSQGYDFRVLVNPQNVYSGFNYNYFAEIIRDYQAVYRSASWRAGRIIMWLPGKIFHFLQRLRNPHE